MIYFLSMWNGDVKKVVIFMGQKTWSKMQNVAKGKGKRKELQIAKQSSVRPWNEGLKKRMEESKKKRKEIRWQNASTDKWSEFYFCGLHTKQKKTHL
jgi:hypothetical protein